MNFKDIDKVIENCIKKSKIQSELAFKCLNETNPDKVCALAYISIANTSMSTVKSLYISFFDTLCDNRIEEIFKSFDAFTDEFITMCNENDSHPYSSDYYNIFLNACKLLGI